MQETTQPTPSSGQKYIVETDAVVQWINEKLDFYSDKDWNYSRIHLATVEISALEGPYLLGCEWIDPATPKGQRELKEVKSEITWGEHHSSELGILEIISLRINKALVSVVGSDGFPLGDPPTKCHPVLRLVKRQDLPTATGPKAIWYHVTEVSGEDFDNR